MEDDEIRNYCGDIYAITYKAARKKITDSLRAHAKNGVIAQSKENDIETAAQKEAIRMATVEGIKHFPTLEASVIWRAVYETHIHRKSGISNADTIAKIVSADQSWKKSSGHAFEEMIKILGTEALRSDGIEIVLQRDLSSLIKVKELANEPRDISWLKEQIKASVFDLYTIATRENRRFCYGCIQSKTSIRDRVTRDREPSMQAMQSFFWSTIIVLDGDFLKLPKFISMVNGGTTEHVENGWHGMYVFSKQYTKDRIYPIDLSFKNFREHAITAANYWLTQRQWFNEKWRADDVTNR